MTVMRTLRLRAATPLAGLAVLLASAAAAPAGGLTPQDIIAKLKPGAAHGAALVEITAQDLIAKLKPASTRGIMPCTRGARAVIRRADDTRARRTVELMIPFAYNSDRISPEAEQLLDAVGQALTDKQLACHDFMLAGHTDAVGSATYNLSLSERRARAVQAYLSEKYGVPAQRLEARGFGKERLLDPRDPTGAENRRVEIVNLTATP